jgi:hypothetical protein
MAIQERTIVVGVFEDRDAASCAVEGLKRLGLTDNDIGYILRDQKVSTTEPQVETPQDAAVGGAVAGGLVGAILGAAVALLIPGVGPVLAGGVLASAFAGAAVGVATGGVIGALTAMDVPEEEARYYDQEFQAGRIVVTAQAPGHFSDAVQVMNNCGAYNVNGERVVMETAGT